MICPECSHKIEKGEKFCISCGKSLTIEEANQNKRMEIKRGSQLSIDWNKFKSIPMMVRVGVSVVLVIIIAFLVLRGLKSIPAPLLEKELLKNGGLDSLLNHGESINNITISKRQTNKKDKQDIIYCVLDIIDEEKKTIGCFEYELTYAYYDTGGWCLADAVMLTVSYHPTVGVSDEIVETEMDHYRCDGLSERKIQERSTDLEQGTDRVTVQETVSGLFYDAQYQYEISWKFSETDLIWKKMKASEVESNITYKNCEGIYEDERGHEIIIDNWEEKGTLTIGYWDSREDGVGVDVMHYTDGPQKCMPEVSLPWWSSSSGQGVIREQDYETYVAYQFPYTYDRSPYQTYHKEGVLEMHPNELILSGEFVNYENPRFILKKTKEISQEEVNQEEVKQQEETSQIDTNGIVNYNELTTQEALELLKQNWEKHPKGIPDWLEHDKVVVGDNYVCFGRSEFLDFNGKYYPTETVYYFNNNVLLY